MGTRLGIDIGGTFTDLTGIDEVSGELFHLKIPTNPERPVLGVLEALNQAAINLEELTFLSHGTTIGINAVIERTGAPTAILTTTGFRDSLEMRRSARTHVLDPLMDKPYCFVPRRWRLEVTERTLWDGTIYEPVDEPRLKSTLEWLVAQGIESVAVCFLHSYLNPYNERRVGQLLEAQFPGLYRTLSSDIVPDIGEYERTSTAALNAYIHPVVHRYLTSLEEEFRGRGVRVGLQIMQSNGGIMRADEAARRPIHILESGPAAGSIAAAHVANVVGLKNVVSLDMGGTTTKASVIEDGQPISTVEFELFEEPNKPGSGWPIRVPMIDIVEVGAGGSTMAWLDEGLNLQVGPRSAGAMPGPVCYDRGGTQPTVTDANAVLGRLASLLNGEFPLNIGAARQAISDMIAGPLGLSVEAGAAGILEINDSRAGDLLREMTIARGRDPRDFTLVAFGGAGPLVAAYVIAETEMPQALIPAVPGNFSALGLVMADVVHDAMQTYTFDLEDVDLGRVTELFGEMQTELSQTLRRQGIGENQTSFHPSVDLRYRGQFHVINLSVDSGSLDERSWGHLNAEFHGEHLKLFTYSLEEEPVELVALRIRAMGHFERPPLPSIPRRDLRDSVRATREVYFRELGGSVDCRIYDRELLGAGSEFEGPAIVEELTSTTLVPPGFLASTDEYGNIFIRRIT